MPSSVNADNGVVSGTAGLKSSADNSGVLDLQTNGTTAISISASQVVTFANQPAYTGGTANGVLYLNGSKVLTSGSALTFDGSQLDIPLGSAGTPSLSTPTDPNTGMFFPAADTIAFAEGGVEAMRLDASGNLNMTGGGTANTANTFGFKNRIINGAMVIDQRNAGASVTGTATAYAFPVDRFKFYNTAASKLSGQQSTDAPSGFKNSIVLTSLAATTPGAGDEYQLYHPIEGLNCADLGFGTASAKTVTLSFWTKSSLTGTFAGCLSNSGARSYVFTYTINAANTWEFKTVTIVGDTTGSWNTNTSIGINILWDLGSGSNYNATPNVWNNAFDCRTSGSVNLVGTNGATWYITGVQLEVGTQATSFDFRSYGTELALCQRYYQRYGYGGGGRISAGAQWGGSTGAFAQIPLYPIMRAIPTFNSTANGRVLLEGINWYDATSVSLNGETTTNLAIVALGVASSAAIAGYAAVWGGGGSTVDAQFSAEL